MEAPDTIMIGHIKGVDRRTQKIVDILLGKQAEISFKAGEQEGRKGLKKRHNGREKALG